MARNSSKTADLLKADMAGLLSEWRAGLKAAGADSRITESELHVQTEDLLNAIAAAAGESTEVDDAVWRPVLDELEGLSKARAVQGFSALETARFVFTLKRPLFSRIRRELANDPQAVADETWTISEIVDRLGMHTVKAFQKGREEIISAPAGRAARAVHARGEAVGRHARAADDRHARQRPHPGGDGVAAAAASSRPAPRSPSSTSPACRRWTRSSRSTC